MDANRIGARGVIDVVANQGEAAGELGDWVRARYARAFRTAVMICGNRADAEEAVQDAFLRVWRFRDALPPDGKREAWLYRVLVNTCYSKLRQEVPRRDRERARVERGDELIASAPSPEREGERALTAHDMEAALRDLPEPLRVVIVLRYFADLSEREIATAIRRRPGTVKSRLHEARRRLAADARLAQYAPAAEVTTP